MFKFVKEKFYQDFPPKVIYCCVFRTQGGFLSHNNRVGGFCHYSSPDFDDELSRIELAEVPSTYR